MRHTPEPWRVQDRHHIWADAVHTKIAEFGLQADTERGVACVNACAGINPEAVPKLVNLVEACKQVRWLIEDWLANNDPSSPEGEDCTFFIAALDAAKVMGTGDESMEKHYEDDERQNVPHRR